MSKVMNIKRLNFAGRVVLAPCLQKVTGKIELLKNLF